jgi:hypothetical protein
VFNELISFVFENYVNFVFCFGRNCANFFQGGVQDFNGNSNLTELHVLLSSTIMVANFNSQGGLAWGT